ncbi:MAG: 2-amino-4-hydroxy-6-hydroxymethyldihydropteridine diphosphokinase [Bacteroidota bacterium]
MVQVYIELGGNLGDVHASLDTALAEIESRIAPLSSRSSRYLTEPWGFADQPDFVNMCVGLETKMNPWVMLDILQEIERTLGRVRGLNRNGARTLDIDILFYGHMIFEGQWLEVPHPRMSNRRFVLEPLAEIAGEFVHPVLQRSMTELLAACTDSLKVEKWSG